MDHEQHGGLAMDFIASWRIHGDMDHSGIGRL